MTYLHYLQNRKTPSSMRPGRRGDEHRIALRIRRAIPDRVEMLKIAACLRSVHGQSPVVLPQDGVAVEQQRFCGFEFAGTAERRTLNACGNGSAPMGCRKRGGIDGNRLGA